MTTGNNTMRRPATNVVLGDGQRERLQEFIRYRRPLAALVREAVEQWLERNEGRPRRRGEED